MNFLDRLKIRATSSSATIAKARVAVALIKEKKFTDAETYLRKSIQQSPNIAKFHQLLGECFFVQKRFPEAIECFETSISFDPKVAGCHANLGAAYISIHQFEKGTAATQTAIALNPNHAIALCNLGYIYTCTDKLTEGIELLRQGLARDTNNAQIIVNLTSALRRAGQVEEAERILRFAVSREPASAVHLCNLASFLQRLGRNPEAGEIWESLFHKDLHSIVEPSLCACYFDRVGKHDEMRTIAELALPNQDKTLKNLVSRGMALHFLKRYDDALEAYDAAKAFTKSADESSVVAGNRAQSLLAAGRAEEAKEGFRQSIQDNSEQYSSWHGLGEACLALGHVDEARAAFLKARGLCATFTDPSLGLARVEIAEGNREAALELLSQVLEREPNFYEAQQELDKLRGCAG